MSTTCKNAIFAAVLALAIISAALLMPPTAPPIVMAARPTTVPDLPGVPGDKVPASTGGTFKSGIAIEGDTNETQLTIIGSSAQTGKLLDLQNYTGSAVFGVGYDGLLNINKATAIAVTMGSYITPTSSFQPLSQVFAATPAGTANIAVLPAGTVVVFTNTTTNVITISDTGTIMLSGNFAIGQYDTLALISDGTNWLQWSETDN